jgi:peroxiredoxin
MSSTSLNNLNSNNIFNMKKSILLLSVGLIAVLSAFRAFDNPGGYKVGDTARDFNLKNVDGKMLSLAGIDKAKGYIVVFTCNMCPYAKAYEDRIIALHNKFSAKGFPVVAINANDKDVQPGDSYENMVKRAKDKKFPYAYLYDETQEIAKAYGALRTPHVYLLDKDRKVRYIGAIDDNSEEASEAKEKYVENAVNALIDGKDPVVKETKAIGCGIKWKKAN